LVKLIILHIYNVRLSTRYAGVGCTALCQCRANSNHPTQKTCVDSVGWSSLAMRVAQQYDGWAYITAPLSTLAQLSLFTGLPLPGMHRNHNALPSQTDGQTDTDIIA